MTRVVFHVLDDDPATDDALRFVCELAEQTLNRGESCVVNNSNASVTQRLDTLMWTFRDRSFVPHQTITTTRVASDDSVLIGDASKLQSAPRVLINLEPDLPDQPDRYAEVMELVHGSEATRERARDRFRRYRDLGLSPESNQVDAPRREQE